MKKISVVFLAVLLFIAVPAVEAQPQVPREHLLEWAFSSIYPFHHAPKLTIPLDKRATALFTAHDEVRIIGVRNMNVGVARRVVCGVAHKIANGRIVSALMWPVRVHLFSGELKWVGSVKIDHSECVP